MKGIIPAYAAIFAAGFLLLALGTRAVGATFTTGILWGVHIGLTIAFIATVTLNARAKKEVR